MLKRAGMAGLWGGLLAAAYAYAKFQGGYAAWFLFFATCVIALYVFLTCRYAGRRLVSERRLSATKLTAGGELEVELYIRSLSWWPLVWLMVEDRLPEPWKILETDHIRLFFPGFQKRLSMRYTLSRLPRGKYVLQDTILRTGDVFGLCRKQWVHRRRDEVTVYPRIIPIRYWHAVNQFHAGGSFAQNRMAEDTTNVLGVRDYTPGDRLSRIHWRATARTGTIKSKEFELHVTNEMMFFLNRSEADYAGDKETVFETAVTTTASLIRYALEKKYAVGLVSYGKERMVLPLSRNQEQFVRIMDHLALVQPDSPLPFRETVLREASYLPRGCTAVLISPVLDGELVKLVGFLDYRKIRTELFLLKHAAAMTVEERKRAGKLALFGVHAYLVGSEQELEEAVRGPVAHETFK